MSRVSRSETFMPTHPTRTSRSTACGQRTAISAAIHVRLCQSQSGLLAAFMPHSTPATSGTSGTTSSSHGAFMFSSGTSAQSISATPVKTMKADSRKRAMAPNRTRDIQSFDVFSTSAPTRSA